MDWRLKGTIQRVLGVLPGGDLAHYWLQRSAGGLRRFDAECDAKLDDFGLMAGHLHAAAVAVAGTRFLEVGTGWYPTFPLGLYLLGARSVDTFDLNRHVKPGLVARLIDRLDLAVPRLAALGGLDQTVVLDRFALLARRLQQGASLEVATEGCVRYRAPADAARTGLPPGTVDVVFSNSVLEHVPPPVIEAMFAEARRVLSPGGIMFHSVNCGDHYAYTDPRINQLHYLRFSDAEWARWNNPFLYQNRLRAADFTAMARAAGFAIELDTSRPHPDRLRELQAIMVDPGLARRYPPEQLAITSIDFIARVPR
jgi:SAM-dependent methyltransferase